MPVAADLWGLLERSELLPQSEFERLRGLAQEQGDRDLKSTLQWLVDHSAVTRYQATVLAAGRDGPFRFGDYRVVAKRNLPGRHGHFHAVHVSTGHPVLLDFLAEGYDQPTLARQLAELPKHYKLQHDNLTDCYHLVDLPNYKFLVQENVSDASLAERVEAKGPIAPATAMIYLNQVAHGLDALANSGLSHGAIRPDEILGRSGVCRLVRTPLSQARPFHMDATNPTESGGEWFQLQRPYMAPELFEAGCWPNIQSDLYALGCLLCYMLTGRVPSPVPTATIPDLSSIANLDPHVANFVIPRLLAKSPADRFDSPASLLQETARWDEIRPMKDFLPSRAAYVEAIQSSGISIGNGNIASVSEVVAGDVPEIRHDYSTVVSRAARPARGNWWLWPAITVSLGLAAVLAGRWALRPIESANSAISVVTKDNTTDAGIANVADVGVGTGGENPAESSSESRLDVVTGGADASSQRILVADDDGQSLWAPPTNGAVVDFRYAPQGGQCFVFFRPRDILTSEEGSRVLRALGPKFHALRLEWEKTYSITMDVVESMLVSIVPDVAGDPQFVADVLLQAAADCPDVWRPAARAADVASIGKQSEDPATMIVRVGEIACFLPVEGAGRRLVFGPPAEIDEIAGRGGTAILRREFSKLQSFSDRESHFTVIFAPSYILRDGRSVVSSAYRRLPLAIDDFFGDGIRAALFTLHIANDECFAELRLETTADSQREFRTGIPEKFQQLSARVQAYVVGLSQLDNHWRKIALRYDSMLRFATRQARFGYEEKQIVVNFSLPGPAAHNLVLASELAVAAGASEATLARSERAVDLQTIHDILDQRVSLRLLPQSLEFAVRDLVADVNGSVPGLPFPLRVRIVGADLQAEGITRNQQIRDFHVENSSISDLLTSLVMKANPVTTVTNPNETDQKLVWVVQAEPENANNPIVLITTRKAAQDKGYNLPPAFRNE